MELLEPAQLDRAAMATWYRANRVRTARLFALIDPADDLRTPIPLRHPFIFYAGHIPAFSFLTLVRDALGRPSIDRRLEDLFNRGIDPDGIDEAHKHRRSEWPSRSTILTFSGACDDAVLDALAHADLDQPNNPRLVHAQAAWNILEHEEMHHETLLYIVHQLPDERKTWGIGEVRDVPVARREPIAIPAGLATLGAPRDGRFGWDNEFDAHAVHVPAFGIDAQNVTNGEYLAFVNDGGEVPPFWIERDGTWHLRAFGGTIPLPRSWPVYATNIQAAAFARWSKARLMTEAEYHRAAFGTPGGEERLLPWGDALTAAYGNFDFKRFDPEPVGSYPHGASAWGVHDLIGNGWEWTATPFAPFDGFVPMASYPQYSADFFDDKHFVMKGASPVTSINLVRRSLRNWFRGEYPFMYATFRRVWS